uniref:thiol:disulfide interchange protein n=1 Tax=Catenella fusiformis TaxID=3024791 RepID=UPI0027DA62F6|nr:thiol:disulfide interchange protein [Catenella fusiformis]WCH57430.1 thiol:disulfide interchange protein [Catenella fusiformis]
MKYSPFNLLEITSYYLQQKVYILCVSNLNSLHLSTLVILFLGGNLTSLNPCLISTFPLTISQINNFNNEYYKNLNSLLYGLLSSILITIFTIFIFHKLVLHITLLSSLLTILIGLNLLQILKLNTPFFFNIPANLIRTNNSQTINWIIGFTVGISTSNCSTPILTTIIIWLDNSNSLLLGIIYITFYLIGYILPIYFLTYILTNIKDKESKFLVRTWNYIIPASGFLLIGIGFFSLLENIIT